MSLEKERLGNHQDRKEILEGKIPVVVAGLPGKMATLVLEALYQSDRYVLMANALTSERHANESTQAENLPGGQLVAPEGHLEYLKSLGGIPIVVDYTSPSVVNRNAELYIEAGTPFVMGTTGGDRGKLVEAVRNSGISAVIAPNMAIDVIKLQDMLNNLRLTSPEKYKDWTMSIRESHQATKKDVSGTALSVQEQFEALGATLIGKIDSIRNPEMQRALGIKNLDGHAYHWITLVGPKGELEEHRTSIEGRGQYVEGTLLAIDFLDRKIKAGSRGEVFTMVDVVREGEVA